MKNVAVSTRGLCKSYDNGISALKPIDLDLQGNSVVGVLGPNGAGKTTLIKLLMGLIRPTAGTASVFGHDTVRDSTEIRHRVGYLPQEPRYYEKMTARETLRFKARFYYSGTKPGIERRVGELLETLGLTDKADLPIKGFSGGERQRLGIAQALVSSPDLLVLDEPAASLDPMGRRDVLDIILSLRETGTVLYSTNILDDVQRVSDTVVILNRGELVALAPIDELLAGQRGCVFTAVTRGDTSGVRSAVSVLPWVSELRIETDSDRSTWQVVVTDEVAAEASLFRLLASDDRVAVIEYG
jgi:ABC-2 type transport system ATP-binding protein